MSIVAVQKGKIVVTLFPCPTLEQMAEQIRIVIDVVRHLRSANDEQKREAVRELEALLSRRADCP